jgi:hypothetical protein
MPFCISKRANYPNYYVSYKNPLTGKYGTKKSTGTSDRKLAEKIAYEWLFDQKELARVQRKVFEPIISLVNF